MDMMNPQMMMGGQLPMDPMMGMGDPMPAPPNPGDITALIAMLEQITGPVTGPTPVYASGFKKPSKPDDKNLFGRGIQWRDRYGVAREEMIDTMNWLSGAICGMFDEDVERANNGLTVTKWPIQTMIAEWDMVCAFMAGLPFAVDKPVFDERRKAEVNQLKDTVRFLRRVEVDKHAEKGFGFLPMDEARIFTEFGQIINRNVVNMNDPDFPFDSTLVSPLEVFPEWGGPTGLRRVWRVYRTNCARLFADYGEPTRKELGHLKNAKGAEIDDDTDIDVVEYWDTWYRAVITEGGCRVLPLKAHEYGYVPYTIQYGPLGQPRGVAGAAAAFPNLARRKDQFYDTKNSQWLDDMVHQSVSYFHTMKRAHAQMEALQSRFIGNIKKMDNPPILRYRDDAAADAPKYAMDTGPNGDNELILGHERIEGFPQTPNSVDVQVVMESLAQQNAMLRIPPSMFGLNDKSNVSGTAVNSMTDAGMEKVSPWIAGLEKYHSRRIKQWLLTYRNFGHLVRFRDYDRTGQRTPFMIPVTKPRSGDEPAFELTPDLIDKAGATVDIRLRRVRQADLLPFLNGANLANQMGVMTLETIARELGDTDFDRTFEEWTEETMIKQAITRPEFAEIFGVPRSIMELMKEHQGDPELVRYYQEMLDEWKARFMQPQQQPAQPGVAGAPSMAGSQSPVPALSSTAGAPTADIGMQPGNQGGAVGRPGVIQDQNGMPIPASSMRIG
jgi:hypothetical protein